MRLISRMESWPYVEFTRHSGLRDGKHQCMIGDPIEQVNIDVCDVFSLTF